MGTGSGLRAYYLSRALARLGWSVRLAAPGGGPLPFSAEILVGAPRLALAACRAYDLAVAIKPYPDAWVGLGVARLLGSLAVVDVDDEDGGYRGGAMAAFTRCLQAPAFAVAPFASTHHPLLREKLAARLGADRVFDLPQGVDTEVFDARRLRAQRSSWRAQRGWSRSTLLAFTAHLNIACQSDLLLAVLGPWLRGHPRAVLVVAGSGPDEAKFRAAAAPFGGQVAFLGAVSPAGAAETLAAADCLVSPYGPSEGNRFRVPMKVAESLAMGLPVVCNLVPGLLPLRAFVQEAPAEPAGFGRAVDAALRGGTPKARRGQAWVLKNLDWTGVARRFLGQIRSRRGLPMGTSES
jgi:glycosyltransferase involved in cell wall biosynthesis